MTKFTASSAFRGNADFQGYIQKLDFGEDIFNEFQDITEQMAQLEHQFNSIVKDVGKDLRALRHYGSYGPAPVYCSLQRFANPKRK